MREEQMYPIPVLEVGPPGVGKTARVLASVDHAEVLLLSASSEEDIAGLPYVRGDQEGRTTPPWYDRLTSAHGRGESTVLFLDELDKARREVADTLLTLVASRTLPSGQALPPTTSIRAAANPPEWGGGNGISPAMMSRFAVIPTTPDLPAWCAWARQAHPGPRAEAVIERIEVGEIPLLDHTGEGFDARLTCPRTIDLALQALSHGQDDLVPGLVSAAAATPILAAWHSLHTEETDRAAAVNRRHATPAPVAQAHDRQPLRLPRR